MAVNPPTNVHLAGGSSGNTYYVLNTAASTPNLAWSGASGSGITGYLVKVRTYNGSSWSSFVDYSSSRPTVSTTATSASINVKQPTTAGYQYQYVVYTMAGSTTSSASSADNARPKLVAYSAGKAPTSISISATTTTTASASLTLSWSGAAGGTQNALSSYTIQYYDTAWTNLKTGIGTGTTSYTVTGPAAGKTRYWRVLAVCAHATYTSGQVQCQHYTNGTASIGGSSSTTTSGQDFTLTWTATAGTNNAISVQKIQRSTNNSTWTDAYTGLATTARSYTVSGPTTSSTIYYYRVVVNFARNSVTTGSMSRVYYTNGTGGISIGASGWTTATGNTNLTISRTNGTNSAFSSYTVQRSTDNSNWSNLATGQTGSTYAVAISDTLYYYRAIIYFARNTVTTGSVWTRHYTNGTGSISIGTSGWTTATGNTNLTIGKTAGTNNAFSSYTIQRSTNNSSWSNLATGQTAATYAVAISDTYYYYRAVIYFAHNTVTTGSVSVGHYVTGPTPVATISATQTTTASASLTLSWTATAQTNNAISSFTIQYYDTAWVNLTTGIASDKRSATVTGPAAGKTRYWRVITYYAHNSPTSNQVSTIHYTNGTGSIAIGTSGWTTSTGNTNLTISHTDGTNSVFSSYTIQRSTDNSNWSNLATGQTAATYAVTISDTYYYYRAVIYFGRNTVTTGSVSVGHYTNGTAPTTVTIGVSKLTVDNTTTLSWSGAAAGTNNGLSKYTVEYSDDNGAWTSYSTSATSPLTVACPAAGVTRRYRVTAVYTRNTANSTAYGTVTGYAAPGAPTSVTIPANCYGSTSYTVSWTGATNADHYNMQYRRTTDGAWGSWTNGADKTTTSFTDTWASLPIGEKSQYQIRTVNGAGTVSAWTASNEMTKANTAPTAPGTPSATPTIITNGSISLSWTASEDVDQSTGGALSGYSIEYATRTDSSASWGSWIELTTVSTNSYTHTWSADAFNQIKYRVRAYDSQSAYSGYSDESAIVTRQIDNPVIWPVSALITHDMRPYFKVQYYVADATTLQVRSGDLDADVWGTWTTCANLTDGINTWIGKLPVDVDAVSSSAVQFRIGDDTAFVTHQIQYVAPAYARTIAVGSVISDYNTSHIAEINQLVTYVNDMRQLYNLQSITLSDTVGPFINWRKNICQLQNGIDEVYTAIHGDTFTPRSYTTLAQWPTASEINLVRRRIAGDET